MNKKVITQKYRVVGFAQDGTILDLVDVQVKNPHWKPRQIKKYFKSGGSHRVVTNIVAY